MQATFEQMLVQLGEWVPSGEVVDDGGDDLLLSLGSEGKNCGTD